MDSVVMITTEENLLDSRQSKVRELLGDGMAISSATNDKEREDVWEDESMREELVHLRHHIEYYQDTTQEVRFIRGYLKEIYNQFKSKREVFMTQIVDCQEATLLGLMAHKDIIIWDEEAYKVLAQIEYIPEIQKGRG